MAALPPTETVQVINVDLAVERQKLLREKLGEYFRLLSQRARVKKRLVYTANAEEAPLDKVLRLNRGADALFTGFNYDKGRSETFKDSVSVSSSEELLQVDPQLRYPVIAEHHKLVDQGLLRHTKLVLVGDIHEKIGNFIRSDLPVLVTVYTDKERTQVSQPLPIASAERLDPDPEAEVVEGRPIPIASIHSLRVADLLFEGIVNMPEEGNRFVLKDHTLLDTARKLYLMESARQQVTRELIQEDKLHFVRGKRVFIVLDEDLEHVVAERLTFDQMDNLWRHHTLEEALRTLEGGKSQVVLDYFETQGYDLVFELLSQEERDALLVAVLGPRLPEALAREIQTVRPMVTQLDDAEVESLFYNLPQPLLNEVLETVKERHYERFLSMVPPKIREGMILEFLTAPKNVQAAWRGIGTEERKEILNAQAAGVLATVQLLASDLFRQKFPALKFDFQRNWNSALLSRMGPDEQQATLSHIAQNIQLLTPPKGLVGAQLTAPEIERFMVEYVTRRGTDFYNRLNPLVRKQIWLTVGSEYRDHIAKSLHALDKIEILKGNKEVALEQLFSNAEFLRYARSGEDPAFASTVFLILKKLDKTESKTALLKKLLAAPELKAQRAKAVPAFLADPEHKAAYEKLADHVDDLAFRFDSLICTKAVFRQLLGKPPLENAVVTLVDDLVDPSLYQLLQQGTVSREDYDRFSRTVEKQINELRRRMEAQERDDPVGVYLLETMLMLNEMSNQTLTGSLSAEAVQRLDSRLAIRQRMMDSFAEQLRRIDAFLEKAARQLPQLEKKLAQVRQLAAQHERVYEEEYRKANAVLAECQQLLQLQQRGQQDRRKVALTQRELSLQFFEIIQPLILDKVRSLGNPIRSLLRMVGLGARGSEGAEQRRIFRFSDEQIANILRYKIVFCVKDAVLAQFIATCLRIDNLEDTLFTLATAETLPRKSDIDVLFYGPGYSVQDFADSVKEHRMVRFADQAFYERLLSNEKLKARTKAILTKAERELAAKKARLGAANQSIKALQAKRRQIEASLASLEGEKRALEENIQAHQERRLHYQGEQELLASRLGEVDAQFDQIKARVAELAAEGVGQAGDALAGGREELAARLRNEMTAMNRELARLMYVKGVKDAGEHISKNTQNGILERIEARELYNCAAHPVKKLIVADDSSPVAQNLKRVVVSAALTHFKLSDRAVQEMSIARFGALAEGKDAEAYPFVVLLSDRPEDQYSGLKQVVKKARNLLPETYQLVITPFGDLAKADRASLLYKNLQVLRENSALVNASLSDYTDPAAMREMLQEKAPLNAAS